MQQVECATDYASLRNYLYNMCANKVKRLFRLDSSEFALDCLTGLRYY
jgi:hypothetical protein